MNKIFKTLTTMALISTIQCGYGTGAGTETDPRVLTSWNDMRNNSTLPSGVYILDKYQYYKIKPTKNGNIYLTTNLMIPENVQVTYVSSDYNTTSGSY